jgi:hypothetical protein
MSAVLHSPARQKIRFVVVDECMLGYIDPRTPLSAGILKVSAGRGSGFFPGMGDYPLPLDSAWVRSEACPKPLPLDGSVPVKLDPSRVRPATLADFEVNFPICFESYRTDPRYDFPSS